MAKAISRKDKQKVDILSIKDGLERWSKLYQYCEDKCLFHDKSWLGLYLDNKDLKLCFISKGGIDIAAIPLYVKKPFRMKIGGPIIRSNIQNMKNSKLISYQKAIFEEFAEVISEKNIFYSDIWNYQLNYWYPLMWKGFKQKTGYHYILDIKDIKKCWENFETKIRTDIRKSKKENIKSTLSPFKTFEKLYIQINKKNNRNMKTLDFYKRMVKSVNGKVISAYYKNQVISSILFIEYNDCIYYLDSCNSKEGKRYGSQSLNLWNLIEISNCEKLNFLGSSIPEVESYFRGFGGHPTSYMIISKDPECLMKDVYTLFKKIYKKVLGKV